MLWYALYNVALNAGEQRVDAGTAAMLIQLSPVLVAALAAGFLGERPTVALGFGLVVAFAGVVLIATSTSGDRDRDLLGVALCLVAAAAYAVSLVVQKSLVARISAVQVTWVACAIGTVACLPFASDLAGELGDASAADIGWVAYLGVTTYLVPPITVLMSWAVLSEAPPAMAYVGGALCLLGVAITRRRAAVQPKVV